MQIHKITMHKYIFLLFVITVCAVSGGEIKKLVGLPGTTVEQCINGVCNAKSGTWDINLCGRRLLTVDYWKNAPTEENKKCILNAVKSYTEQFGAIDCSLDGIPTVVFDQFNYCLSNAIKKSGGRYKRSPCIINNNININQYVDNDDDDDDDCDCSC